MSEPLPDWPTYGMDDDVRPALRTALASCRPAALVTIAALGGGGPRPEGAQMVFGEGVVAGFLSGGCGEGDVSAHAAACLADGAPRRLVYGEGSPWPDIRLLCGARIELLVEEVAPGDPAAHALFDFTDARVACDWISDGKRRLCVEAGSERPWPGAILKTYEPKPRLAVVGSDPTALAIAALGVQTGFETTLVRPKGPATPPPLAGMAYRREEAAVALAAIGLDGFSHVAVASHEMDVDHEALVAALASPAAYVGLLGARRRLAERLARLRAAGVGELALSRLRAPIGLDLGGKAPWEVAVAVLAEIQALRQARASGNTSTNSPTAAAGAPAGRLSRASAAANTETSDES